MVEIEGTGQKLESPLKLVIEPVHFPEKPALTLTMWDYAHDGGLYDLNRGNLAAAIAHMQSYPYTAPWALSTLFPHPQAGHFDAAGNLTNGLDFSRFDA